MRRYEPSDYSDLEEWIKKRGMLLASKMELPEIGIIEPGIGCGFLVQTDIKTAILDFFFSNPEASRKRRHDALFEIGQGLIQEARWLDYKRVSCSSRFVITQDLARSLGFRELGEFTDFIREV